MGGGGGGGGAPNEDHLWQELAVGAGLVDHLPVDEEQLLDLVVVAGDAEADHRHEQLRHHLSVERQRDQRLEPTDLLVDLEGEGAGTGEGAREGEGAGAGEGKGEGEREGEGGTCELDLLILKLLSDLVLVGRRVLVVVQQDGAVALHRHGDPPAQAAERARVTGKGLGSWHAWSPRSRGRGGRAGVWARMGRQAIYATPRSTRLTRDRLRRGRTPAARIVARLASAHAAALHAKGGVKTDGDNSR